MDIKLLEEAKQDGIQSDNILYDIYDLKRLGDRDSHLLQFDCVFLREDSNLLKVKF